MKQKPLTKCRHCKGKGVVPLTGVYAETYWLVRKHPGLNGAELAKVAGCKATAMNNRLNALRKHGLILGRMFGRQIIWELDVY